MDIITADYDHVKLKSEFHNSIRDSVEYLKDFTEAKVSIPCISKFSWRTVASYYMATVSIEKEKKESCINYLSYLSMTEKRSSGISIEALDYTKIDPFTLNLLYSILEKDDKGVRTGYIKSNFMAEKEKINKALHILRKHDYSAYKEINCHIDTIYLTGPGEGYYIRSGCNFYMSGLILLYGHEKNSVPYYIEHIIHECAHHTLNVINSCDELVTNDISERFSAPLRNDPRPMIGLFHAFFVLSRIYQTLKKLSQIDLPEYNQEINERVNLTMKRLLSTKATIRSHATFTATGRMIFNAIEDIISEQH